MNERPTILLQDAREVDPASAEFDFVLTDPPYSPYVHENTVSSSVRGEGDETFMCVRAKEYSYDALDDRLVEQVSCFCAEAKGWALVFTDTKSIHRWHEGFAKAGATWRSDLIWHRWSSPQPGNLKPPHRYELIPAAHGPGVSWNGSGDWDGFHAKAMRGESKYAGQKPLELALEAIRLFSSPGDLGIDLCSGSGTFALAAWLLDREFIAFEGKLDAFEISQRRLGRAYRGEFEKSDITGIARHLAKYPEDFEHLKQKIPSARIESILLNQARDARAAQKAMLLKIVNDDETGEYREYIQKLYQKRGVE
jgi:hypothetical protein